NATVCVLTDVAHLHHHHIRGVSTCDLRGHFVPVTSPVGEVGGDGDVRMVLLECLDQVLIQFVACIRSPPGPADRGFTFGYGLIVGTVLLFNVVRLPTGRQGESTCNSQRDALRREPFAGCTADCTHGVLLIFFRGRQCPAGSAHHWYRGCERSEEHTSELQSRFDLVCRLLLEKKKQR